MVCKKGLLVDQVQITAIIDTTTLTTVKSLCATLGHTCCRGNVLPVIGSDHRQSKGKITNLTFQNVVIMPIKRRESLGKYLWLVG